MDTSTYEILKECNSGCRMALNSIEQLAVYLKSQELQDLFCKYKEDYEKMEKESIRLSEGKLQEEKLSEKAAETFAWISAEVKMMLNDDSSKIAEMMIDGARELAAVYLDLQKKCENAQISSRAMDLRGLLDGVALMEKGLDVLDALDMGITNKTFDSYEQTLIQDTIRGRISKKLKPEDLFEKNGQAADDRKSRR